MKKVRFVFLIKFNGGTDFQEHFIDTDEKVKENLSLEDIDFIESSAADFYGNYYKGKYITVCLISYMVLKD